MDKPYIEHQIFDKIDYTIIPLPKGNYEHCTFINCNFSNSDLSMRVFTACEFKGCNLSMAKLGKTVLSDAVFKDCKLLGLHFENCNEILFAVNFDNCILDMSSFYKRKQTKMKILICRS